MKFFRYILPVVTAFIIFRISWFTITDFEGNSLGVTLTGGGDGVSEVWVPTGFEEIGGFPFGYILVAVLAIALALMGKKRDDPEDANLALVGTGIITLVLTVVSLFLKNLVIGASPEELTIEGYAPMEFSLAAGFCLVLALSAAMTVIGAIGLVIEEEDDEDSGAADAGTDRATSPSV